MRSPSPERSENYGSEVWRRLQPKLHATGFSLSGWLPRKLILAAAMAALLVAAFLAGRYSPRETPKLAQAVPAAQQVQDRVLLVAVGDYLERSQMVLVELTNTHVRGPVDISAEQERAEDLIGETRLYRQTAASSGEAAMAGMLEELERVLLDIARRPSKVTEPELEELRKRIEAQGILFKIRVVGSNVREREQKISKTQL